MGGKYRGGAGVRAIGIDDAIGIFLFIVALTTLLSYYTLFVLIYTEIVKQIKQWSFDRGDGGVASDTWRCW